MNLHDFNYTLPKELIAQSPLSNRANSRLLVMDKQTGKVTDDTFTSLTQYLRPGDCLVLNDTRVLPARLIGKKADTGAEVEFLLLHQVDSRIWEVMVRPGRRIRTGGTFLFGTDENPLTARVLDVIENGNRLVEFTFSGNFFELLDEIGAMPLPPYITERLEEKERYQTVYNKNLGSAAAPTAGLHFTEDLLQAISKMGVSIAYVTLHVGIGTFRPVKVEDVTTHEMHSEFYALTKENADLINASRCSGGRVICVGTTSCRTIETIANEDGTVAPGSGWTNIFIYPGYRFKVTDALITNFHLPESTLLMLVCAFAGQAETLAAYVHAVEQEYRFFSFGDAMLLI